MLSPKMQRSVRVNENQLIMLSDKAQHDNSMVRKYRYENLKIEYPTLFHFSTFPQHCQEMKGERRAGRDTFFFQKYSCETSC